MLMLCNKSSSVTTKPEAELLQTFATVQLYAAGMPTAFAYAQPSLPPEAGKATSIPDDCIIAM
jgi:hypothetical protein